MIKHHKSKSNENNDKNKNSGLENEFPKKSNNILVWLIFSVGFIIISLSIISAIFPALLISVIGYEEFLEPFEISPIGVPIIVINIISISLVILHIKQSLPKLFLDYIQKFLSFDLSKKNSLIFLIIILAIYITVSVNELSMNELQQYGDFLILDNALEIWPNNESENVYVSEQLTRHVRMILLVISDEIFDNVKFIPFLASIFLLITTYFLTIKFAKKNFAGLIAVILILQSSTFLTFDTIAVYENFWVLFYVLSIYLILDKPRISSIFYFFSIFSKAITVLMLPVTIIVTLLSDIPSKRKFFVVFTHVVVLIVSIGIFQFSNTIYGSVIDINTSEFFTGFSTLAFNLRFDVFLLLFLLPVSMGLFLKAKNGSKNAISLIVLIGGTILVTPILEMVTEFYFVYPYRYIPLIVFFAISLSSLFSKR